MKGLLLDIAGQAVRRALRAGAGQAEAYLQERRTTTVELRDGRVDAIVAATSRGLGLLALVGGARGYAYSPDLSPRGLGELARRAVAMAREVAPEPARALPELSPPSGQDLAIFDPALETLATERKVELLHAAVQAARDLDPRAHDVDLARYSDASGGVALATSSGFAGSYQAGYASLQVTVVGRQGDQALRGFGFSAARRFDELSPNDVGRQAAYRATAPLGGTPVPSQRATVVLDPTVAAQFLTNVAAAVSAEAVLKDRSMLLGRLGEMVAAPGVQLVDQGNLPGGLGSAPFDDEGVPTGSTVVVEAGIFKSYLHSTYTARRTGGRSTGNAIRAGYRALTAVGPTNFSIRPTSGRDALLRDLERGLYVVATRNVGGINPVTGDYSVGALGVWIERGEPRGPVAGVTIAAGMLDMLRGIAAVGDDLRWSPQNGGVVGAPTLRIEGMTIGCA